MKNTAKALNLKNMKETLINYSGEQKELENIWNWFWHMATMGFITRDTWNRFYDQCAGWYVTDDGSCVRDMNRDDALVWEYTGDAVYTA